MIASLVSREVTGQCAMIRADMDIRLSSMEAELESSKALVHQLQATQETGFQNQETQTRIQRKSITKLERMMTKMLQAQGVEADEDDEASTESRPKAAKR